MFLWNSMNSVTKIFVIAVIESTLWLSDLSDSLNLLNSLGSMKVLLNSGKNANVIEKITEKY